MKLFFRRKYRPSLYKFLTLPLAVFLTLGVVALFPAADVVSVKAASPERGGRVVVASPQEPRTLLPHFDLLTVTHELQNLAFDCLFTLDPTGNYVPQLAAEVPTLKNGGISPDARTYTIRLREGVTWHDGQPFTSADVKFTWHVITDPNLPIPSRVVWKDIERIETPDPHTVKIHFAQTNVGFLAAAATDNCHILPKHLLEGTDIVNSPLNRKPIGTGPFMVEEWVSGSYIQLVRNPNYRIAGKPYLDEIVFRIIPGTQGQRAALQRGEVDLLLHLTAADAAFVSRLANYEVVQAPTYAWWHFWLNNSDPILQDRAVRQALAYGLNKAAITEGVMRGLVEPLHAVLPPSHWAHNPDVKRYPYDPKKAKALLEEAGWVVGPGGVRRKDGQRLSLEILNIAGQAERLQVVEIVQAYWRRLGIDVAIRQIDGPAFPPTMAQGDYQVAYGWFSERHEPVFALWLGTNWQRYDDGAALDLLRQAITTVDREKRRALIRRFQAVVAEDMPTLPLAPRTILNAVSDRLQGYEPGFSGSLWNAADWSVR